MDMDVRCLKQRKVESNYFGKELRMESWSCGVEAWELVNHEW